MGYGPARTPESGKLRVASAVYGPVASIAIQLPSRFVVTNPSSHETSPNPSRSGTRGTVRFQRCAARTRWIRPAPSLQDGLPSRPSRGPPAASRHGAGLRPCCPMQRIRAVSSAVRTTFSMPARSKDAKTRQGTRALQEPARPSPEGDRLPNLRTGIRTPLLPPRQSPAKCPGVAPAADDLGCDIGFPHGSRPRPQWRCPERLNARADASVTAVACANQVSRRFGDVRVVLEDILRLDSNDSVPGMPSRHGRTTLFTDDFWNVRHNLHHRRQQRSSECRCRVPLHRTLVRR